MSRGEVAEVPTEALDVIARALRDLRFGQVTVVIHDGRVVQVERVEKHRLKDT